MRHKFLAILDSGLISFGNWNGKVNSATDFNENSMEKIIKTMN